MPSSIGHTNIKNESIKRNARSVGISLLFAYPRSFRAALLLGSSGDAMGYKNGRWEFLKDGVRLHQELKNQFGRLTLGDSETYHD